MITYKKNPNTAEELDTLLHPDVKKWFFSNFKAYSIPQLYGVMNIHSRKNTLISAPTGSTKTLTAFLAIINEIYDLSKKNLLENKVYAIYISPLKALNNDIEKNLLEPLNALNQYHEHKIKISVRTGDTTQSEKQKMLKETPHILITTPESLAIMLCSQKFAAKLGDVQWIVIDEIHALAENKRGVHLSLSLENLNTVSKGVCRIGLSATVSPIEEVGKFLVGAGRDCEIVDVQFLKGADLKVLSPVPDLTNTSYAKITHETYLLLDKLISEHKTTLIFTNTRAQTERVVHYLKAKFPKKYHNIDNEDQSTGKSLIGAHHGSLSKEMRLSIENKLKNGELKCVVCSTSLELGIDIGYIDLVILLGSPKSVARALQRVGRAGHKLHSEPKGRIIIQDRDDLVECAVLLKNAVEKKLDKIHIPKNSLDVLSQQIIGFILNKNYEVKELYDILRKSYCFENLDFKDYLEVLSFLAGDFGELYNARVFGKIFYDHEKGTIRRKGIMTRVLYMTNIGTIPDQQGVIVKVGEYSIGSIDEAFLERLKPHDIFVLGGQTYEYKYSRGNVATVNSVAGKKPTVPSWFSDMLPLSYELAKSILEFRYKIAEKFKSQEKKENTINFILEYLYVNEIAAEAIYNYLKEQSDYSVISTHKNLLIEKYDDNGKKYYFFHFLFGRRVNDALSRIFGYAAGRLFKIDFELGISDIGFYLASKSDINIQKLIDVTIHENPHNMLSLAIEKTEVMKRRFRHCAGRALMILRTHKGEKKSVGRQMVSSTIIYNAAKRISEDFPILKEARREVMEDLMDVSSAIEVLKSLNTKIKIEYEEHVIPSPFAFNMLAQGYSDILKVEDKHEFLVRMHKMVLAKIALEQGKKGQKSDYKLEEKIDDLTENEKFDYHKLWKKEEKEKQDDAELAKNKLLMDFKRAARKIDLDPQIQYDIAKLIDGEKEGFRRDTIVWLENFFKGAIPNIWSDELVRFLEEKLKKIR